MLHVDGQAEKDVYPSPKIWLDVPGKLFSTALHQPCISVDEDKDGAAKTRPNDIEKPVSELLGSVSINLVHLLRAIDHFGGHQQN